MTKQITLTLKQLSKFVDNFYTIRRKALRECIPILYNTLYTEVFTDHNDTYTISTIAELESLISGGSDHNPSQPRKGPAYNPEYLKRKERMGEHKPHKYENYGFWQGTQAFFDSGSLVLETQYQETNEKDFDYLSHHEERRSVLKLTFLRAWQTLIEKMIDVFAKEMVKL